MSRRPFPLALALLIAVAVAVAGCSDGTTRAKARTVTRTETQTKTKTVTTSGAPKTDHGHIRLRVVHEPKGADERTAAKVLGSTALRDSIADIDDAFLLRRDIVIRVGDGSPDDGPYYDPNDGEIRFPYSFVEDTRSEFDKNDYATGGDLTDATREATEFVLYHELAHALIDQLHLPVLGREEDAADSFAVLLAVELEDDGDIAISAADSFDETSDEDDSDVAAYYDEHSLDEQRFYSLLCLVYGSDTKRYADAFHDVKIDHDRKSSCPDDWQATKANWHQVIDPYLAD